MTATKTPRGNMLLTLAAGVQVEVLCNDRDEFVGLGAVTVGGVPLRATTRPITIRLDTPDGYIYPTLILRGAAKLPDGGVRVQLAARGIHWDRGEYLDDYGQNVLWLEPYAESVEDDLALVLKPVTLAMGGRQWQGFSYAVEFASTKREIHRLLVHATWEIGGRITGNTVLQQGQCNRPVYRGARETVFTTACLRTLGGHGTPQGNSFQLGPRAGLLQGFDFQHAAAGTLFQYWPEFKPVSSLLESKAGEDTLHVIDEYRFDLGTAAATTPKWILFSAGALAEHEARDLWWEAREFVYGGLCAAFGVTPTPVLPEAGMHYRARVAGESLRMSICGEEVDHAEVLYAVGDRLLPRLAAAGIRRFFPEVMSESDPTQIGMRRKLDDGPHGDLHCASVCATHRFFPSDYWGGITGWRYMAQKARALGIEIGAWFAPHFSPRAPIFQQHPEYRMIDVSGFPAAGGYGFQTLAVADWNSGIYDWVLNDIRRWQEEGGLDYLFIDSYSNLGMLQVNYAARMRTNFAAFARLLAEIQKSGVKAFTAESIIAFGASRFGLADLRGDLLEQDRSVAGQNDYGWWHGEEDMAGNLCLGVWPRKRSAEDLEHACFRTMAAGGYLMVDGLVDQMYDYPEWSVRLHHLGNQAQPFMTGPRRLLPGGAGIAWGTLPGGQLLWTFKDYELAADGGVHIEQLDGQRLAALGHGPARLPAWGVYRLSSQV